MTDAGYIAVGFLVTFVVLGLYLTTLHSRLRQAQRVHESYRPRDPR